MFNIKLILLPCGAVLSVMIPKKVENALNRNGSLALCTCISRVLIIAVEAVLGNFTPGIALIVYNRCIQYVH